MTSLSASYKGFVILAQAELTGRGGPCVGAGERQYVPLTIVAGASGIDRAAPGAPPRLRLFRAKGQNAAPDPYRAMTTAIGYARDLVDALAGGLVISAVPGVGEFEWGGTRWRWDTLDVTQWDALQHRLPAGS